MLNRFIKERGDLLLFIISLMWKTALEYVLLMEAKRSKLKMKYFLKDGKIHCWSWQESWVNDGERGSTSVRQLIQIMENNPDRHVHHQDRRQNQSFNFFSPESKQITNDSGCWKHRIMWMSRDGTQKRSAQCVYHIGTLVYPTARAGISCIKKEGRIRNSSVS